MRRIRHFCRFTCLVIIVGLIHQSHQDFLTDLQEKGQPILLIEVQEVLPSVFSLVPDSDDPSKLQALDQNENLLGMVTQTSPKGDSAIGFSGSTNLLVIFDNKQKVSSVSIRSSGDTTDHVDAILKEPNFFNQFVGKSKEQLARPPKIEAVSGATLTSLAIADAISLRFGGEKKVSRFPNPIQVEEVKQYLTRAARISASPTHPSLLEIYDVNDSMIGLTGRSSPHTDQIIGYQGPVDSLLVFDLNGSLIGMKIRSSYENQPYADYPNDDAYFASLFSGRSIPQLADMNLTEEEVEGVSGATMTSMAMAEGIVKVAQSWEEEKQAQLANQKPFINWKMRDFGSLSVILLAGFVGLLSLAALLVPMATGKAFYCHQLCPHGAAQQWMRKLRKKPVRLPKNVDNILKYLPASLVGLVVFLSFTTSAHTVAIIEPFDAYIWEVAGGITIAIALLSLLASAFIPMAYCRYGCPTGAMLRLFEFGKNDHGWTRRDYSSFGLLLLSILLYIIV